MIINQYQLSLKKEYQKNKIPLFIFLIKFLLFSIFLQNYKRHIISNGNIKI